MQVSVLAGTVFQDTHLPLRVWFRAMWHITSQKNGVSALGLQRALGLGSYKTAWLILHKLRQAMVRPGRERLRGVVEVDETYWGAAESGGVTGRLVYSTALIVVAAEQDGKGIGRIRMARIPDFDRATLHGFIRSSVETGSTVCTDGLNSYREMKGYIHHRHVQHRLKDGEHLLPRVHPSGFSAQAMDARNLSGSYRLPTPRRLPQRIRLPLQPTKGGFARQALLPLGTARPPDRPDDLRKAGAATRC
jgi:hypothetical protein